MQIRRKGNVKKKAGILGVILIFFSLLFINAPPIYAANVSQNQIDVGEFNVWLHSDGVTWQSIPGYGVKKPGDTVTVTYTVTYDGPASDKVVGVKGASFYTGDQNIYNTTYRKDWQIYDIYEGHIDKYRVTNMTNVRAVYKGNRQVQMTVTIDLKTAAMHGSPARWGLDISEPWQAKMTNGRKFYIPTLIEWQIEGTGHSLTVQIEGQGSTTPAGSKAPGTVHRNMSGSVAVNAVPADGWKFSKWVDVTAGNTTFSVAPNSFVNVNQNKTIRAVFIPADETPPPSNKEYLTVVPSRYTLFEGDYNRFKAYHHKADGSTPEVTNGAEWSISNSNIARLSTTTKGELWGVKEGQVLLTAKYKGMEGTSNVTVIPEPVPPPPNYKPKADFDISNSSPIEGEQVHFYDSSTHEGNRYGEEIVSWEWTFEEIGSSYEQNPEATWNEVGTYKVRLRVEDQDGDSDSCTKSVVVGPAIPAAVITTSTDHIIMGREIHIDGDESTAAMDRDIKWDEMEWKFYNPNNTLAYEYIGRYPLGKGTDGEKELTNNVLNKTGNWRITLKVKDTNDNESEITEKIIQVLPDNPPIADFWLAEEGIRNSYEGYEITVRDLSTPDNPDGSLGDEIYERTWTLYYDTNNDGNAKGSGDEIIHPGDKGKSAEIIQASNNDPRPVIRFKKTGRYQLELKVKERYEAWGEIIEGLTADTEDKALEEKQIMVINLAPTVAFDIKKKTPVDILFAADYTVSDAKYNSLESGQPAFINELESGFIEPEVEVERVKSGTPTLILDVGSPYENDHWAYSGPYFKSMGTTVDPSWRNIYYGPYISASRYWQLTAKHINIHTGEMRDGFLTAAPQKLQFPYSRSYEYIGATSPTSSVATLNGTTKNRKFTINAEKGLFKVLNTSGQIVASQEVPQSNRGKNFDRPMMIAPWGGNQTVVVYTNLIDSKDYLYFFLINNETGMIVSNAEVEGVFGNRTNAAHSDLGHSRLEIQKLGEKVIGVITSYETTSSDSRYNFNVRSYVIKDDFALTKIDEVDWDHTERKGNNTLKLYPLGNDYYLSIKYSQTSSYAGSPEDFTISLNNPNIIIEEYFWGSYYKVPLNIKLTAGSRRTEWQGGTMHYMEHLPYFAFYDDYSFIDRSFNEDKYINKYFDNQGNLVWQLETNEAVHVPRDRKQNLGGIGGYLHELYVGTAKRFMGYIVLTNTWEGDGSITYLVNPNNGQIAHTFPYKWLGHDEEFLLMQSSMGKDTVLIGYSQLQGLQYLKQAIENHTWDADKFNVVTSVIDGDSFTDFAAQKDSIKSLLQANNLRLAVISPAAGKIKTQAEELISANPDGGWWIQTASNMSSPLSNLAKKIIEAVNEDRGADNIVLVGQEAELKANYNDMEKDPADIMEWSFKHDNENLGSSLQLVNKAGISTLHNTKQTVLLDSNNQNQFDIVFDQAGTYLVHCRARDYPVTTSDYLEDEKAGKKWSNQDAYITVIAHHKPIANFTINSSSIHKNAPLDITDNSYDPDLYSVITKATTDPFNQKGIRAWEWQYKKPDGTWEKHLTNDNIPPTVYANAGTYQIRLRVQDVFEAWSDWTDTKTFNVVNRPPIANFTVDPNPASVGNRSMVIDSSYDLDGEDEIIEWKWEIEKGLGETETIIRTSSAPFPYIWNMEGTFNVKLTVKDIEGATGSITKPVTVLLNHPPVAVIKLPAEIFTDEWFIADGTSSYDPDGDIITKAYWQYMKPGDTNWSATHTQELGGSFTVPKESFLKYPIYPQDGEHGVWKLRLIVEDDKGLASLPAEVSFNILEGWEITGSILPEVGERGRYMRVMAYAHRKNKPNEKYTIDSMKAELVYLDEALTKSGRAAAESIETLNMPYNSSKADFRQDYLVGEKVYDTNRWPADGRYYVKVIGQKGSTQKHIAIPYSVKGNIHQRLYIRTMSW